MPKMLLMLPAVILTIAAARSNAMEVPTCDALVNAIDFCTRYATTAEQRNAMEKNREKVSEMARAGNPLATAYCKTDLPSWTDCSGLINFDWVLEGTDNQGNRHYYDRANITTDRFGATVWTGVALAKPKKFLDGRLYNSFITHMHADCATQSGDWMDRHIWFVGSNFTGELFENTKQDDKPFGIARAGMSQEICGSR